MIKRAWWLVKPETIANCFRHAGFGQPLLEEKKISLKMLFVLVCILYVRIRV